MSAEPAEHPWYTTDSQLACAATKIGNGHTCRCVYRLYICDGADHLCLCGDDWRTPRGTCTCSQPRDKDKS